MRANFFRLAGVVTGVKFDAEKRQVSLSLRADDADAEYQKDDAKGSGLRVAMFSDYLANIEGAQHAEKGALVVVEGYLRYAKGAAWLNATSIAFAEAPKEQAVPKAGLADAVAAARTAAA